MVCHGERATTEIAPQDRERGHPGMPLPEPGAIREARSGRVREAGRGEEGPWSGVEGLGDEIPEKQKEGERGCGG